VKESAAIPRLTVDSAMRVVTIALITIVALIALWCADHEEYARACWYLLMAIWMRLPYKVTQ